MLTSYSFTDICSMKHSITMFVFILLFTKTFSQEKNQSFSEQLNPSGNPIGGGVDYKNILQKKNANYLVNDKQTLLSALQKAKAGELIYVEDTASIDLSSETNLIIPSGVTLASGRGNKGDGALLFSDSTWSDKEFHSLFTTGGENVRITGLRLRGPNPDILDHDYNLNKVACAVRCQHPALEIDNSELWAWDKWAIYLYITDKAHIHHNYIHHTIRNGYGYGVWLGGSKIEKYAHALIEANLFEACRHCTSKARARVRIWPSPKRLMDMSVPVELVCFQVPLLTTAASPTKAFQPSELPAVLKFQTCPAAA